MKEHNSYNYIDHELISSSYYMKYFNSYSAKVIAYVLVIFFILFHGFLHVEYG